MKRHSAKANENHSRTEGDYARFEGIAPHARRIVVIGGAGYVGAVIAAGLAHLGHRVFAVDIDLERLALLRQGVSLVREQNLADLLRIHQTSGRLTFSDDLAKGLGDADVAFIAVNTPRSGNGEVDLADIIEVAESLGRHLHRYLVIAVKSTVPVGSHLAMQRVLEGMGRREGTDYDIVANPEFVREGNAVHDFFYPDRIVVGGSSRDAMALVREMFEPLGAPILETTTENAQLIKYAANAFLAMRISFINEVANICEHVGSDVLEVARGLGFDRRIGHEYLRPGVGFSGPCLPKDLEGLIRLAQDAGYEPFFLKAILEKNEHQRRQIIGKVHSLLGTSLFGRRIGVLGLSFKPETDDTRNSVAPVIVDYLLQRGAEVRVYDPTLSEGTNLPGDAVPSPYDAATSADLLLLLTGWEEFAALDFQRIKEVMRNPNIVDGVNVLEPTAMRRLGFAYLAVGRQ